MTTVLVPPGPKPKVLRGYLPEFRKDPLGLLTSVGRAYSGIARLQLGPVFFYLLTDPDFIEQVLVTENKKFVKGRALAETRRVLGNGLLTAEGDFWRRQRRLAQPAFHRNRIAAYAETMVGFALRQVDGWAADEVRDIHHEMTRLTLAIAAKTLFSADVETDAERVGAALGAVMEAFNKRTRALIKIPASWPTPTNRRYERAAQELDDVIYKIINQRRESGEDTGDLLSMLIHAEDEDGSRMTPEQLRDEAMTIFLAGHETTSNALSWTWYLLSEHPEVEERLHAELAGVLVGRAPTVEDLPKLPYTTAIITEAMRLYPPAWIMSRLASEPFTLGSYEFPAGTQVLMSQWVSHRHPRYFPEPEAFRPERWLDGLAKRLPAYAYFPFGGGPRLCIGKPFAEMEAVLVLATIAQRYRLRLVPGHPVEPQPLITLRPKYGIKMRVEAR